MKTIAVGTLPVLGAVGAQGRSGDRSVASGPVRDNNAEDSFTMRGPENALAGQHTYLSHTSRLEYWGTVPRPLKTETDKWGHIFRIGGRGQTGTFYQNWWENETKEDAGEYPYLSGHAINVKNFHSDVKLPSQKEAQDGGDLGANPAAQNRPMDNTERAENLFKGLLGLAPAIGEVQTATTIARNLYADKRSAGNRTFSWHLDSIYGYSYETTANTNHQLQFEIWAEPGETIEGDIVSISFPGGKLSGMGPQGVLWNTRCRTPDEAPGSNVMQTQTTMAVPPGVGLEPVDRIVVPDLVEITNETIGENGR